MLHLSATTKKLQGQCLRIVSRVTPVKLHCCYVVIIILTVAVIALSVALSVEKKGLICEICPRNWILFGKKYYYFSENIRNWTCSQISHVELKAKLTQHEAQREW
ncbi:C-type lectin domain family 2 member H-like [Peromyscus leucopus]|uniref:C-type lectin domain family 2 member H-like n=1 Tax=Peromyscus leucopus TaxID=10041 RepID=UPI0018852515|nr:C-type lectin domain family 2 member H-like [Peromyscus leucopus]